MQQDDFLQGQEVRLQQSKLFFEPNLPLLDQFFSSPYYNEAEALFALDEMIYYFKTQIRTQKTVFCFLPALPSSLESRFPRYFSLLADMTDQAIDLLKEKLAERVTQRTTPQALRDFYDLWLGCLEEIYQKWLPQPAMLAAFAELMEGQFS